MAYSQPASSPHTNGTKAVPTTCPPNFKKYPNNNFQVFHLLLTGW